MNFDWIDLGRPGWEARDCCHTTGAPVCLDDSTNQTREPLTGPTDASTHTKIMIGYFLGNYNSNTMMGKWMPGLTPTFLLFFTAGNDVIVISFLLLFQLWRHVWQARLPQTSAAVCEKKRWKDGASSLFVHAPQGLKGSDRQYNQHERGVCAPMPWHLSSARVAGAARLELDRLSPLL